jgi:hypothetical protein
LDNTARMQHSKYNLLVNNIEGAGFNVGIFDAAIPIVAHVDRATTATTQVAQLLSSEKAFSASGQ